MDVVPEEVDVPTAISFARQAILALKGNTSLQRESRKYGTLIFTAKSKKLEASAVTFLRFNAPRGFCHKLSAESLEMRNICELQSIGLAMN